jgi:heme/copper-type cytochrome/quinol oxidase subunit 4
MNDAITTYTVVVLIAVPTVMFGGFSLLRLLVASRLNDFQRTMFRAGHAHAGVLLILCLAVLDVMARGGVVAAWCWVIGGLLITGVLAQSGGMFLHMAVGETGRWSAGNTLSTVGAVVLAVGLLLVAYKIAVA